MTTIFRSQPDRFYAEQDGKIVFDTEAFPVQFFGQGAEILVEDQSIEFPDAVKGNAYSYGRGTYEGSLRTGCASYITIGPQEWSEDTVLGTVPEGTDMLLAFVKLTRTVTPSQILSKTIPVCIEQGKWVNATGGIVLEALAPMVRILQFFIDGTNVVMRQKQSVLNKSYTFWRTDNNPSLSGWTYAGAAGKKGHIVYGPVQSKGPQLDPSLALNARGTATQCSLTDPTDYSSTYVGDIQIIPGIHRLTEEEIGGSGSGRFFTYNDSYNSTGSVTNFEATADLGEEAEDRVIVVVAHAMYNGAASSGRRIENCLIGGVGGTSIPRRVRASLEENYSGSNWANCCVALFSALVPAGTSALIRIEASATFEGMGFSVYSLYGLSSAVPVSDADSTYGSTTLASSVSVANDGSIVIGATATNSGHTIPLAQTGLDNTFSEFIVTDRLQYQASFEYADAGTVTLTGTIQRAAQVLAAFY